MLQLAVKCSRSVHPNATNIINTRSYRSAAFAKAGRKFCETPKRLSVRMMTSLPPSPHTGSSAVSSIRRFWSRAKSSPLGRDERRLHGLRNFVVQTWKGSTSASDIAKFFGASFYVVVISLCVGCVFYRWISFAADNMSQRKRNQLHNE